MEIQYDGNTSDTAGSYLHIAFYIADDVARIENSVLNSGDSVEPTRIGD